MNSQKKSAVELVREIESELNLNLITYRDEDFGCECWDIVSHKANDPECLHLSIYFVSGIDRNEEPDDPFKQRYVDHLKFELSDCIGGVEEQDWDNISGSELKEKVRTALETMYHKI